MASKFMTNTIEYRDLGEKAYDLFGELLLQQETDELLAEIENDKDSKSLDKYDAFYTRQDAINLKRIHRYFKLQYFRTFIFQTLPKIGQVAAILIAVVTIAGSIAIATSHTLRIQVMKLLVQIEEQYTKLSLVEDMEASFDIPSEWTGEYYPSYIPENFTANVIASFPGNHMVEFINNESSTVRLTFSEFNNSTTANIDTERATVKAIVLGNNNGFIAVKDSNINIYWDNGRVYFVIQAKQITESEAIRIAQSVMYVK